MNVNKGLLALLVAVGVLGFAQGAFASVSYTYSYPSPYSNPYSGSVPHWNYFSYSDLLVGVGAGYGYGYGYSNPIPYGPYWASGGCMANCYGHYGYGYGNGYGYGSAYGFGSAFYPYVQYGYGNLPVGYPYSVYPVSDYYYTKTFYSQPLG